MQMIIIENLLIRPHSLQNRNRFVKFFISTHISIEKIFLKNNSIGRITQLQKYYQYNFSAFLHASNSVLDYVKENDKQLFRNSISNNCNLIFMRNIRNINTHHKPQKGKMLQVLHLGSNEPYVDNHFFFEGINWNLLGSHIFDHCKKRCCNSNNTCPDCIKNKFVTDSSRIFLNNLKNFIKSNNIS